MQNRREGGDKYKDDLNYKSDTQWNNSDRLSKELKIALTVLTSPNDFKDLMDQFM